VSNPRYDVGGKSISKLYYDPARPSAFSTLQKLRLAAKKGKPDVIRAWLEKQDAHTLHRPVRKRFARNPLIDVWEYDLLHVEPYAKYNDNYKYILSVIDVFSKYLHLIPIKTNNGPSVALAFRSIFDDPKCSTGRGPIWVRTDKGKEFLNKHFQDMLRDEGFQFQVCRNTELKCAAVERVQRMIRDRL